MRNIKVTLNFQMNYGVLKTTTTPQISHEKYFVNTRRITLNTKRCSLCFNEKLEIARYKGHNLLHKLSEIINESRHENKFALARYDSKDRIWFFVTALE